MIGRKRKFSGRQPDDEDHLDKSESRKTKEHLLRSKLLELTKPFKAARIEQVQRRDEDSGVDLRLIDLAMIVSAQMPNVVCLRDLIEKVLRAEEV